MRKNMNVKLAAQLLGDSVAKSLQFCVNEEIGDFKDCEPTIDFFLCNEHKELTCPWIQMPFAEEKC